MPRHQPPGCAPSPEHLSGPHHAIAQETSTERTSSVNPLLHRGKLLIATVALACGGLAASAAAAQAAQAAIHPAAAMAAHAQPGSPYQPPDPC
jgi:hypothetical protein